MDSTRHEWRCDSPVAMGHPMHHNALPGHVWPSSGPAVQQQDHGNQLFDINGYGNPREWYQNALIQEREQDILAQEVASGRIKVSPTETPFNSKPANPKQAFGDKKPPLHLIHMIAQLHEAAALHGGRRKYGENNYIKTPVEAMTYVGAILRHVQQWTSGERVDAKELVHHLGAIKACCTILLTAEATGFLIDNRPSTGYEDALDKSVNACTPPTYQQATQEAFSEVERTIEHLNKLYPPFQG